VDYIYLYLNRLRRSLLRLPLLRPMISDRRPRVCTVSHCQVTLSALRLLDCVIMELCVCIRVDVQREGSTSRLKQWDVVLRNIEFPIQSIISEKRLSITTYTLLDHIDRIHPKQSNKMASLSRTAVRSAPSIHIRGISASATSLAAAKGKPGMSYPLFSFLIYLGPVVSRC
jgi:hypothetical protein